LASSVIQSEARQPESDATKTSQPALTDPVGTDKSPFVVTIQPAPKTDDERTEEKQQAADRRLAQLLGAGTLLLLGFQVALIGWQVKISSRQNKLFDAQNTIMNAQSTIANGQLVATGKSALAAQTSAETARDALALSAATFIELKGHDVAVSTNAGGVTAMEAHYGIANTSNNVARDVRVGILYGFNGVLNRSASTQFDVLAPGKRFYTSIPLGVLTSHENQLLSSGSLYVSVRITVNYTNPLGWPDTLIFQRELRSPSGGTKWLSIRL
jgi:hypothetical protein